MKTRVFAGTHGNEWTGIYLIKDPDLQKFSDVDFEPANPKAINQKVRYIDDDLNRSFTQPKRELTRTYEHLRAQQIHQKIIEDKIELVIDLHTTTSNMGNTIIFSALDKKTLEICGKLASVSPDVKFIYTPDPEKKYLMSSAPFGLLIEVGPIPHNCLNPNIYNNTKKILLNLLNIIQEHQEHECIDFDYYEEFDAVKYKYSNNQLNSMVHPLRQDKDFLSLSPGDPILMTFDGESILYNPKDYNHLPDQNVNKEVYPIFINEAAYYDYTKAMGLTVKKRHNFNIK